MNYKLWLKTGKNIIFFPQEAVTALRADVERLERSQAAASASNPADETLQANLTVLDGKVWLLYNITFLLIIFYQSLIALSWDWWKCGSFQQNPCSAHVRGIILKLNNLGGSWRSPAHSVVHKHQLPAK